MAIFSAFSVFWHELCFYFEKLLVVLDKLGCASEKKIKNFVFHFVFHSACTNFAV